MSDISKVQMPSGTIYGLKDTEARKRVPETLLKSTVGWSGKNLADNSKTKSMASATMSVFSLNDNGGFSLSGSIQYLASLTPLSNLVVGEQYIASIKVVSSTNSDARLTLRNSTNQIQTSILFGTTPGVYELPFTYQDGWYLSVICNFTATQSSMEIEEIMVRKADITDPTFEPYHESVEEEIEQIYTDNGVLGAKNIAPNIATTNTTNNLTFTVNDDKTISTSGTPSANTFLTVSSTRYGLKLEVGKKYKISGCPSGGSVNTYKMDFRYDNNGVTTVVTEDVGNGAEFIYTQDMENASQPCLFIIRVASGTDMTDKTFKPMIRLASDPDDTYVPYAMTNRELTPKTETVSLETGISKWTENLLCKMGRIVVCNLTVTGTFAQNAEVTIGTIPSGYRPSNILYFPLGVATGNGSIRVQADGVIKIISYTAQTAVSICATWITN